MHLSLKTLNAKHYILNLDIPFKIVATKTPKHHNHNRVIISLNCTSRTTLVMEHLFTIQVRTASGVLCMATYISFQITPFFKYTFVAPVYISMMENVNSCKTIYH